MITAATAYLVTTGEYDDYRPVGFLEFVQTEWPELLLGLIITLATAAFVYAFLKEMQR